MTEHHKDCRGKALAIGDRVGFSECGSAEMNHGKITRFTSKKIGIGQYETKFPKQVILTDKFVQEEDAEI